MITDVGKLNRGAAYRFVFANEYFVDALIVDYSPNTVAEPKNMVLYHIQNDKVQIDQRFEMSNDSFVSAEPIALENCVEIQESLQSALEQLITSYNDCCSIMYEEDMVDAIEQKEDTIVAAKLLKNISAEDSQIAVSTVGFVVNNFPYVLKRVPANKVAFLILLAAVDRICKETDWTDIPFSLPVFPDQLQLFAHENVEVLRKMAYQVRTYMESTIVQNPTKSARRYIGNLQSVQKSRQQGQILYAGTERIPFKFCCVADDRLATILENGFQEVGGVEVEFSIGYIPEHGGEMVSPCCQDIVMTPNSVELCNRASHRFALSNVFSLSEDYRINPVCPTSHLPDSLNLLPMRVAHEGKLYNGYSDAIPGLRLFHPMGTKSGKIVRFDFRTTVDGRLVGEGEIVHKGNAIHFNILQVIDAELYSKLRNDPMSCIGQEVCFELAFNARKNALALWADAVRCSEAQIEIPPKYDPDTAWTASKDEEKWDKPTNISPDYIMLQPWLPIMNSLLDNCVYGVLDTTTLGNASYSGTVSSVPTEGRIFFDSSRQRWCKFQFSSVADQYLRTLLFSSLRYQLADKFSDEIGVIFSPQPSGLPGKYVADWVILTSNSRNRLYEQWPYFTVSVTRPLKIADGFLPYSVWGKPRAVQTKALLRLQNSIFFDDTPTAGVITQFFGKRGIITATGVDVRYSFTVNQIADRQLSENITETPYANYPVTFLKRQAPLSKQKRITTPLAADYIVSSNIRSEDRLLSAQYLSLADEAAGVLPEEKQSNDEHTKQSPERNKSIRTGMLVMPAQMKYAPNKFAVVDDHPILWATAEGKMVVSHFAVSMECISDERLRTKLNGGSESEKSIKVTYSLVKNTLGELIADNIRLADQPECFLLAADYQPTKGEVLSAESIEEAVRYHGYVTNNTGPYNIFIRLSENISFQAEGFNRQVDFHTCTNDVARGRYYILDKKVQEALEGGHRDLQVSFIPTVAFQQNREPEASYIVSDQWEPDYVELMRSKLYVENINRENAQVAIPTITDRGESGLFNNQNLDSLIYHAKQNVFDDLIAGKKPELKGHFSRVSEMFATDNIPSRQANFLIMQLGQENNKYAGINNAPRAMRFAYADALVRNYSLVFGEEGYLRMLNCLVDIYMARATGLLTAYDAKAYSILKELFSRLEACNGDRTKLLQVQGRLNRQDELCGAGIVISSAPMFHLTSLETEDCEVQQTQSTNSQPQLEHSSDGTTFLQRLLDSVPLLAILQQECGLPSDAVIHSWETAEEHTFSPSELIALYTADKIASDSHDRFIRCLMNALLNETERLYLKNQNVSERMASAAYLYGVVIRLYFQAKNNNPHYWDTENYRLRYFDFPHNAISLAFTGIDTYHKQVESINSAVNARRGARRYRYLWQASQEYTMDLLKLIPNANQETTTDVAEHYILLLLQTLWLSECALDIFLNKEEYEKLDGAPWRRALNNLRENFGTAYDSFKQLSDVFCSKMEKITNEISQLFKRPDGGLKVLSELTHAQPSIHALLEQLSSIGLPTKQMTDLLGILDETRKALENQRRSDAVSKLCDIHNDLIRIKNEYITYPTYESHLIVRIIHQFVMAIRQQLDLYCMNDSPPQLKVVQCGINKYRKYFLVAIKLVSEVHSLRRSGVLLKLASIPACLGDDIEYPATFDLQSGEERVYEIRFPIKEDVDAFRERQTVEIGFEYSCTVQKTNKDGREIYEPHNESVIWLNCPVNAESWEIKKGSFGTNSTQYTSEDKERFVGRKDELKKLWDALYDETSKRFRSGVGMTIAGRRRTGKSWLAGRFCEIVSERGTGQIVVCKKIDISQHIKRPGDLTQRIITEIVNGFTNEFPFVQNICDSLKPAMMLSHIRDRLNVLQQYETLEQLDNLLKQLSDCGINNSVDFSLFYHELIKTYQEKTGSELPPILIVLDEFTSVPDKIMNGVITKEEVISIVKLIEAHRINILLICADSVNHAKQFIDENAFLHYKNDVFVDGISEEETCQMLCRAVEIKSKTTGQMKNESCFDREAALQLHKWYDGNVYLLAMAAELIIMYMNTNEYLRFKSYHLQTAFRRVLLESTMKEKFLQAYTDDKRLSDEYSQVVLRWLNIQAMAEVANNGGISPYKSVLMRVQKEWEMLFNSSDRSRLMNLLRSKRVIAPEDFPLIAQRIVEDLMNPRDVVQWLFDRGVFRWKAMENSSANAGKVDEAPRVVLLPLTAYVEARNLGLCQGLEELPVLSVDNSILLQQ